MAKWTGRSPVGSRQLRLAHRVVTSFPNADQSQVFTTSCVAFANPPIPPRTSVKIGLSLSMILAKSNIMGFCNGLIKNERQNTKAIMNRVTPGASRQSGPNVDASVGRNLCSLFENI